MHSNPDFLKREDCVLLLVDIQKVLLDRCVDADRVSKRSAALIDAAALFNIPLFFSVHNAEKLGGFLPELTEKTERPHILPKLEFSCFQNVGIFKAIQETGRRTLLLAGLETHVCIFHTATDALRLGYAVHLAVDAVSSGDTLNKDLGLRRMERAGAVLSSTEMIIFELLNRAGTPEFKAALPLIKQLG
jgi:nicotinamidase-related amidase